ETLHIAVGDDDPSSVEILNRGLCRIERDWKFISAWREASSLDDNAYRVGLVWNARARGMSIKRIAARVHRPRRWVRHIIKSSRALERESRREDVCGLPHSKRGKEPSREARHDGDEARIFAATWTATRLANTITWDC